MRGREEMTAVTMATNQSYKQVGVGVYTVMHASIIVTISYEMFGVMKIDN